MALIKCPECGAEISDKAVRCPRCGAPAEEKNEKADSKLTLSAVADEHESVGQSSISNKKSHKFGNVLIIILAMAVLGGAVLKFALDYISRETIKHQLISNTDYVKEHIVGAWATPDGKITEFYKNGNIVEYTLIQGSIYEDNLIPSIIQAEFINYGYGTYNYIIPDPNSFTDKELQNYADYVQHTDNIGIKIETDFHNFKDGGDILCEFQDENTLTMNQGKTIYTRIDSGEPQITSDASGLYVCEDGHFWVSIIERTNTNGGYCNVIDTERKKQWINLCEIHGDQIVTAMSDVTDIPVCIYERRGTNLIGIGSEQLPGSQLTFKKVSNLAYCSPVNVIPNGETATTPEEPPVVSDGSGDKTVVEGSWEPTTYPKNPGDDSAIRIYFKGYEPAGLDVICCYGTVKNDWIATDLVFTASEPVTDFRIVDLKMPELPSDDYFYSVGETLLDVGELLTEQAITASLSFADIPTWGIIYTGSDGRTRVFSVGDNGGGRGIEELEGYAPGVCMWEDVLLETLN